MEENKNLKKANTFRFIARYSLLVLGVAVLIFALLSGANDYGGGLMGIIKNSPNALPWAALLVVLFIAWKKEKIGGVILTVLGIVLVYFFNFSGPNFWWSTFIITLLIPILGSFFLISDYLRKGTIK